MKGYWIWRLSMSDAARQAVLQEQLKALKLATVRQELEGVARQARNEGWPYEEFLRELFDREIKIRSQRASARRLREAHFPDIKTLEQIDWKALKGVPRPKLLELASGDFLDAAEDVVIAGPVDLPTYCTTLLSV
jgi:DNA replication protein DnaC